MFSRQLHSLFSSFSALVLKYGIDCPSWCGSTSPGQLAQPATQTAGQGREVPGAAFGVLTGGIWAGGFPRTTLGWGSAPPVSSRCIWEDTALFFQASYPIFFLSFFFLRLNKSMCVT